MIPDATPHAFGEYGQSEPLEQWQTPHFNVGRARGYWRTPWLHPFKLGLSCSAARGSGPQIGLL